MHDGESDIMVRVDTLLQDLLLQESLDESLTQQVNMKADKLIDAVAAQAVGRLLRRHG